MSEHICTVYENLPSRTICQKKFTFLHINNMVGNIQMLSEVVVGLEAYTTVFFILFKCNTVMSRVDILFKEA